MATGAKTLTLNRHHGESIRLQVRGVDVWITLDFTRARSGVNLAIEAPAEVRIQREELVPADERRGAA